VIGKRIVHEGVLGDFGDGDVLSDIVNVGTVVLPHQEELPAVAEHCRPDAALLKAGVLLHDRDIPAIELAKLCIALLDDLLAAGDVEEAGDFLVHVPFPNRARQRHDVLARVVGDEETGGSLQLLRGLRDVAQLEVGDFAGEREIARAVEQAAVVAVATPRQNQRGDFHDLVAFAAHRVEHHQLLKHPVRREFIRRKVGKGEVADFLAGPGVFQEFQHRRFLELALIFLRFCRVGCFPVAEVRKSFEGRRAGRHFFGAKILQRHRVPGDVEQLVVSFLLPILKRILVKQVQVFGDLRLPEHLFVLLTRSANHPRHERAHGRNERRPGNHSRRRCGNGRAHPAARLSLSVVDMGGDFFRGGEGGCVRLGF